MKLILSAILIFSTACATYHFGKGARALPGGYDRVSVPMFANKTQEVGVEPYFTEALRLEFERSHIASVTSEVDSQLVLEGIIESITYLQSNPITSQSTTLITPHPFSVPQQVSPGVVQPVPVTNPLPNYASIYAQYVVQVKILLNARKNSDHSILWSSEFVSSRPYNAPLLGTPALANGTPGLNTASPLYNQVSRVDTVSKLARDMMSEAHDRLTENF
jgi:lipopolysaccharide assembly LptE-like protein